MKAYITYAKTIVFIMSLVICVSSAFSAQNSESTLRVDWLDTSTSPSQNFYTYANGKWQKQTSIPPEYASWGSFYTLEHETQQKIRQLVIQTAANQSNKMGSIEQKIADFYLSGMDETTINKLGIEPLKPQFSRINAIKNLSDLQSVMTELQMLGVNVFFNLDSMQDYHNSNQMIGVVRQGGLGLPDRDYYLDEDEKFQLTRKSYQEHIAKMFALLGDTPEQSTKNASIVMNIETQLAKASMSQIDLRDFNAIYNMKDLEALKKMTPHFSWPQYFTAMGQPQIKRINVATPHFFMKLDQQLQDIPLDNWKTYLRWHLVNAFAPYLSQPFVDQNFQMTALLTGAKKMSSREERVVNAANSLLNFAIGKLYVEKYFSPSDKEKVLEIVKNIRQNLRQDLETLSWMSPATRKVALKKLDLMKERIGYPDKWWDYSKLMINKDSYIDNVIRTNQFLVKRNLNKIGKPVDRSEWRQPPQAIDAYVDFSMNVFTVTAGILQPPFFDPKAPAAINYGGIGFVIGHELTHAFDDQGARFDAYGNLKDWWTPEDLKKFQAATHCIANQFSQYKVEGNLSVQGKLVVGEATADLGGVILAYNAFHDSKAYKTAKSIQGFTPDQQFFLGFAHVLASNHRPEQIRNLIITDTHPPMLHRVNGTLANMPQFQKIFGIKAGPMVNEKRCVIW